MRIYVANDNFVPCPLNVNPYETISSLKPRICEIFGLTGEQMNQRLLVLDGRGLNPTLTLENGYDLLQFDGTTLQEFGIKEEETLRLGWKGPFVIKLVAETFAHEITVGDCYETVHDLKMRIEGVTGEPVTEENFPEFFSSPAAANHTLLSFGLYKLVNHCYVQHTIFRNRKNLIFPEKCQGLDVSQGHASVDPGHYSWPSSSGQVKAYQNDTGPIENGTPSTLWPYYDPHNNISREGKDGINTASQASTSVSLSASNETQGYSNYPPHTSSANSYVFDNAEQMNYYNAYSHQAYDSSSQQMGANQNSGAPCQPLSSFQSSYVTPASYPDTYNVNGDHQTGYIPISQTNYWNDPNYGGYPQHYPSYPSSDTNSAQTTSTAAASSQYFGQSYNQWPYHSFAPNVSCAPRTENTSVNTTYSAASLAQIGSVSYPYPSNQPPPPGTTSWRKDSDSSALPSLQEVKHVSSSSQKDGWEAGASGFPNYSVHQNPSYFQTPYESVPPHRNSEDLHKTIYPQGPTSQLPLNNQASENFPLPLQTETTYDTRRPNKMQIPTNPRIASNFSGMQKVNRESSTTINKPAYIGVNVSNHTEPEVKEKHGTFPAALSAYVERTLARCKDDAQRTSTQNIMKEMITKASADGTLFTRNWDMEPLFPLPNTSNLADQNNAARPVAISPLPERNSTRRSKSRWGPIPEETSIEKLASASNGFAKDVSRDNLKATVRDVDSRRFEKDSGLNGLKFVLSQQHMSVNKIAQRPVKKPRFSDSSIVIENGEASSDSDKEQSLTKYYASATALSDSPEERKRREHRSKRFDKGKENHAEAKHTRQTAGSGNMYIRRASTMLLAKKFENGSSRAVEDIDWDALTVKGTSQEIEKRYLRLTSAPDPTTVRPEEILGKALHMVQTSSKNYLYKCDQLKSIRQDLTVQRIQNELTVKVYETHARLALEAGDVPEFNQCQSQLKRLYSDGIKGSHMEFSAYNLLCVILHSNNKRDLLSSMARLSEEAKEDEAVKHALAVRSAVSRGNYILFFKLYKAAPNMNTCLMDLYVEKIRYEAVKCMSKSYRPMVPVSYVARVLGFSRTVRNEDGQDKEIDGLEECGEWLRAHGATLIVDNSGELQIDTKVSSSNLYMPDPEDAVAHGDATLAVNDFLTRAL